MLQEEITSRLYDTSQELSNSVWQLDASGTEVKRPWYGQSMGRRGLAGDERQNSLQVQGDESYKLHRDENRKLHRYENRLDK